MKNINIKHYNQVCNQPRLLSSKKIAKSHKYFLETVTEVNN